MMTSSRVFAADLIKQLELRSCPQANQNRQTAAACLEAGLAELTRDSQGRCQLIHRNQVRAISRYRGGSRFANKRKIDMR
jgi:hypothetical protein